jgi:hypothetical protein
MGRFPTLVQIGEKVKEVKATEFAVKHKKCPVVYSHIYAPHADKIFSWRGAQRVNSYNRDDIPKANSDWEVGTNWQPVRDHIQTMFDDPSDGELIIKWMAYNVKHPGDKILWAPVVCGVQGDGKSTIRNILGAVMGSDNVKDVSVSEVFSQFNAYAEGSCVAALEEVRFKGHNRHDVMNALKPLLTNPVVAVTRKGRDALQVPNTTNYIAFTNHPDALALDKDDRRWAVFFSKFKDRAQLLAERDTAYWNKLHSTYQNHPGDVRGWLLSIDLSDFDHLAPPAMNAGKLRMISESQTDDAKGIMEAVESMDDIVTTQEIVRVCKSFGVGTNVTAVGRVLSDMGFKKGNRIRVHGDRIVPWYSESLATLCPADVGIDDWVKVKAMDIFPEDPFDPS